MMSDSINNPEEAEEVSVPEHGDSMDPDTLDLSGQGLEKLTRAQPECQLNTTTLILDGNELQRLDNIHTYQCLEKVGTQFPPILFPPFVICRCLSLLQNCPFLLCVIYLLLDGA